MASGSLTNGPSLVQYLKTQLYQPYGWKWRYRKKIQKSARSLARRSVNNELTTYSGRPRVCVCSMHAAV